MKTKILFVFFLLFMAFGTFFIFKDVQVSRQAEQMASQLESGAYDAAEEENVETLLESYTQIQNDRLYTLIFICIYSAIVLGIVLAVGKQRTAVKKVSQDEAVSVIEEIDKSYIDNNQLCEEDDDKTEEAEDELEAPVLNDLRYENSGVVISWERSADAQGYIIYKQSVGKWRRLEKVKDTVSEYIDYNLASDVTYMYRVKAFRRDINGTVYSKSTDNDKTIYIEKGNIPEVPELKIGTDADGNRCIIWTPDAKAVKYQIFRRPETGTWESLIKVSAQEKPVFIDKNAEPGKTYYYTVRASRLIHHEVVRGKFDKEGIKVQW